MNNITTITGHVLLPHQADTSTPPTSERVWMTGRDTALTGAEQRVGVRPLPWIRLNYQVLCYNAVEQSRFDMRYQAAMRAGKIVVPHWGRSARLADTAMADHRSLTIDRDRHGFQAQQYVLIQSQVAAEFDSWDYALVTGVEGRVLRLDSALSRQYEIGTRVWRLLFGRPIEPDFECVSNARTRTQVSVLCDRKQINAIAQDDFSEYELGIVTGDLNGGTGWSGPWQSGAIAA